MVKFNFVGELNNAEFGEGKTQKKKGESTRIWSDSAAKTHIGIATGMGALGGYKLGQASNRSKLMKQGLSVSDPKVMTGSGWKRKLAGAAIGTAILGGGTYLSHRVDPRSPIGKKNEKDNPYTKEQKQKDSVWTPNKAKASIALGSALGGYGGYNIGKIINMKKAVKNKDVLGALTGDIKGGWKAKLAGSLIAGGAFAGAGYLAHKNNPTSPIGKESIIKPKDLDGRSDKGKKRLKKYNRK
jgi:predicted secreted protein